MNQQRDRRKRGQAMVAWIAVVALVGVPVLGVILSRL